MQSLHKRVYCDCTRFSVSNGQLNASDVLYFMSNVLQGTLLRDLKRDSMSVLFVGNLSYFCEESHLAKLFEQYGVVKKIQIIRHSDNGDESTSRSLLFGFVTMSCEAFAKEVERVLNHHMFMGRRLR